MNKTVRDIAVGIGISIALLGMAEVGFRIFWKVMWPQDPRWWRITDEAGIKYAPGKYENGTTPIGFSGNVNSLGYRGTEWTLEKTRGTVRIICVGDSVVLGLGTSQIGADFPTQLESILNRKKGPNHYEVLNAGLGGNTSFQTLYRIEHELINYHPDVFIVSVGPNDMIEMNPGLPTTYRRGGLVKKLIQHSYLLRAWAGLAFKVLLPKLPISASELEQKKKQFNAFVPEAYRANLREMAHFCKEHNVRLVFATLPTLACTPQAEQFLTTKIRLPYYARDLSLLRIMIQRYNDSIRRVSHEENVPLAELATFYETLPKAPDYFGDNVHMTDAGYHLYAEQLAKFLPEKILTNARTEIPLPKGS